MNKKPFQRRMRWIIVKQTNKVDKQPGTGWIIHTCT